MRFTQHHVAKILKMNSGSTLSELENGTSMPTLLTALKLAAIYRAPVEALFEEIFLAVREQIRQREQQVPLQRRTVAPMVWP